MQRAACTGRATDSSGGALPGVTVSVTSPNLIGGARTAVTDDEGLYRIVAPERQLHREVRAPGFTILNIEGVLISTSATMTINGKLESTSLRRR